jgi:hypothetical protein
MLLLRSDVLNTSDQAVAGQDVRSDCAFLLQELFTALLGVSGDVFIDSRTSRYISAAKSMQIWMDRSRPEGTSAAYAFPA